MARYRGTMRVLLASTSPARRALLVADLHFEKASWFARGGQMLPPAVPLPLRGMP